LIYSALAANSLAAAVGAPVAGCRIGSSAGYSAMERHQNSRQEEVAGKSSKPLIIKAVITHSLSGSMVNIR